MAIVVASTAAALLCNLPPLSLTSSHLPLFAEILVLSLHFWLKASTHKCKGSRQAQNLSCYCESLTFVEEDCIKSEAGVGQEGEEREQECTEVQKALSRDCHPRARMAQTPPGPPPPSPLPLGGVS